MPEKHTYKHIKSYVESLGYVLIDKEYFRAGFPLHLVDKAGYFYSALFGNLERGAIPDKFNKSNPNTIQNIKLWCKLNNKSFELLSGKYEGSAVKLQWQCLKANCGEVFEMCWQDIYAGCECSFCTGKRVGINNCLATKFPDIAKEWHPTKNGNLTPYGITCSGKQRIWWQCKNGHKWQDRARNRIKYMECPFCNHQRCSKDYNLLTCNPDLCNEWNYEKNKKRPEEYLPNSNWKVWWKCKECNEAWYANIISRNSGVGCPYCSGRKAILSNCLATKNSDLASEWHTNLNGSLTPYDVTCGSKKKVWWQCKNNQKHKWKAPIYCRSKAGCPYCSGYLPSEGYNLLACNPKLCEEWDYSKNKKRPEEYTPSTNKKVWWVCKECNTSWIAQINNRSNGSGCPECNSSKGEKRIKTLLDLKNIAYVPQKGFDGLVGLGGGNLSYDFYLPQYNLLVEYQGEQHERYIKGLHKSKKDFENQQEHDRRKCEYASNNEINFLEVWYYDFDSIEEILSKVL